jgi:hypothetical protein
MTSSQAPSQPATPLRPRRWNVEIDGICWLPRMADKARMRESGTLGAYLMRHSPVDRALLARLGLTTDEFVALALANPDDAALLAALRGRGFDEARVRRWCGGFTKNYATFIRLWDLDEGYRAANAFQRPVVAFARVVEAPIMSAFRKISPAP